MAISVCHRNKSTIMSFAVVLLLENLDGGANFIYRKIEDGTSA